ncbi:hypothetical protein NQ314_012228 [Rhamnusium bicolor]|uniref:Uncharacterized protein n=1 Tax=Rhamnusium bicolor TaxID=1586634 RepID=A0AAV8XDR8_9CUCU|nr:hypothetical protein NQ314_012228 [Rhamnusium bicolor]
MRLKKAVAVFGSLIVILLIFMIYSAKDLTGFPNRKSSINQDYQDVSF